MQTIMPSPNKEKFEETEIILHMLIVYGRKPQLKNRNPYLA